MTRIHRDGGNFGNKSLTMDGIDLCGTGECYHCYPSDKISICQMGRPDVDRDIQLRIRPALRGNWYFRSDCDDGCTNTSSPTSYVARTAGSVLTIGPRELRVIVMFVIRVVLMTTCLEDM
jgi:hypothetical protein